VLLAVAALWAVVSLGLAAQWRAGTRDLEAFDRVVMESMVIPAKPGGRGRS
jgi:hypothetical protein